MSHSHTYTKTEVERRVLITGIGGFIGSHFLEYFLREHPAWTIIGLDSFMHKGTYTRLNDIEGYDHDRVRVFYHDLATPIDDVLAAKLASYNPLADKKPFDYIFNLASDSHVDRSITDPIGCWLNNTRIISSILEYARKAAPEKFFHISTDEVYGDYQETDPACRGHVEWDVIMPSNPYSASKAAQEALAIAYWRTYEVPVILCNTMNNIGERQDHEKFLPRLIRQVMQNGVVQVHTDDNGKCGSRVYLDAQNHASALSFLTTKAHNVYNGGKEDDRPSRFNVCGRTEFTNLELAQKVAHILGKELQYGLVCVHGQRPGYDKRYLLDGRKLHEEGWSPDYQIDETIRRIIRHIQKNPEWK